MKIIYHYKCTWQVLDRHEKLVWLIKVIACILASICPIIIRRNIFTSIRERIFEFGRWPVICCFGFIATVFWFAYGHEYAKIIEVSLPDLQFPFYQKCGMSSRQFKLLRLQRSIPMMVIAIVWTTCIGFPLFESITMFILFCFVYTSALFALVLTNKQRKNGTKVDRMLLRVSNAGFQANRKCVLLMYSIYSKSFRLCCISSVAVGLFAEIATHELWMGFLFFAWCSFYMALARTDDHYRHRDFYKWIPQTYGSLITDDMVLISCIYFCFVILALLTAVITRCNCSHIGWIVIAIFTGLTNHLFVLCYMDSMLPQINAMESRGGILVILMFLFVIPGLSLVSLLLLMLRRFNQMTKPVHWGD